MSTWWYVTLFKCPDCGATWEEYDHTGGNYDSGHSGPRTVSARCEECLDTHEYQERDAQ